MKFQKFQNLNVRSKELFSQGVKKDEERKKERKKERKETHHFLHQK